MDSVEFDLGDIRLTIPSVDDVPAIYTACQDAELQRRIPVPVPYLLTHAEGYVTTFIPRGWSDGTHLTWAIRHNNRFAGIVSLDRIAAGGAAIGYWMDPAFRSRGIMSRAVPEVVTYAFEDLSLDRLEWRAFAGNKASAAVASKAGFRFEGCLRLGAVGRNGREDDWVAGITSADDRAPQSWSVLGESAHSAASPGGRLLAHGS
ncbi:GNAT family N-acetyltransferase [Diaminobutyricimonas sp. LJ205]|uniref:GNAT family N-acetyltransferase n=1 Tax=Diaminobutyricimonas sp. LJ205 TaxID=2683590 RepID=UPI0012F524FE|nr:GNAT family protein [Diaminobutyricimonas sp. LJ205]